MIAGRRLPTPRAYAEALCLLPPECQPLGLRIVPPAWRALVAYLVLVYIPTLRRLAVARERKFGAAA